MDSGETPNCFASRNAGIAGLCTALTAISGISRLAAKLFAYRSSSSVPVDDLLSR